MQITDTIYQAVIIFHSKIRRGERIYTKWIYKGQRICKNSIAFCLIYNPTQTMALSAFCHNLWFHILWESEYRHPELKQTFFLVCCHFAQVFWFFTVYSCIEHSVNISYFFSFKSIHGFLTWNVVDVFSSKACLEAPMHPKKWYACSLWFGNVVMLTHFLSEWNVMADNLMPEEQQLIQL